MPWRRAGQTVFLLLVIAWLSAVPPPGSRGEPAPPAGPAADPCRFPLPLPSKVGVEAFNARFDPFLDRRCYITLGWPHDAGRRDAREVHGGWVINYYSPEVVAWLKTGRQGRLPDGAVIVKEMWADPACTDRATCFNGVAPMVKDRKGSWDGWFWGSGSAGNEITYPYSGFGQYCLNCHASAVSESTFADLAFLAAAATPHEPRKAPLTGRPPPETPLHQKRARPQGAPRETLGARPSGSAAADYAKALRAPAPVTPDEVLKLPGEALDRVVSDSTAPGLFITSDQCLGCHDATESNPRRAPNMIFPPGGHKDSGVLNFSPYGEAHASLMGLSGRDPVFYAQLESEGVVHPKEKAAIQNTCFSCHGVMGQRQLQIDRQQPFSLEMVYATGSDPYAKYGALARDGVSCTVCHHIAINDRVPFEETFTGKFFVGPADEVYGPYRDDVRTKPMEHALNLTPKPGSQIRSSKVCGSCHTVYVDVLGSDPPKKTFEQATYLEWLNSSYQDEIAPHGDTPQTCQQCHMPQRYQGTALAYKIANIEDATFPPMRFQLPDPEITLQQRTPFPRHALVGINLFTQEMFRQFTDCARHPKDCTGNNAILGVRTIDPMIYPGDYGSPKRPLDLAAESALDLAQNKTAEIAVASLTRTATVLETVVRVTNLAGHHLPSGVGFRRAFIEFQVLDAGGNVLWSSGRTSPQGVILGADGKPLPSEFFQTLRGTQAYQPHWQVIDSQDKVQIYEELTQDCTGRFTTSFLSLCIHVKDNRLQPRGWKKDGPWATVTGPDGEALKDCAYTVNPRCPDFGKPSTGADAVTYRVPLAALRGAPATVSATLYYQSLPPYYKADRFSLLAKCPQPAPKECFPETRRLFYLASNLDVGVSIAGQKPIQDWKLRITSTRAPVK